LRAIKDLRTAPPCLPVPPTIKISCGILRVVCERLKSERKEREREGFGSNGGALEHPQTSDLSKQSSSLSLDQSALPIS